MALTDEERASIIEEERLRWTTRRVLMEDTWAQAGHRWGHRRRFGRALFWLPLLALAVLCLRRSVCHF